MAKFPHIPLFVEAWIAKTHHMSRCERGTYMDLLMLMWMTPGCRVPNDNLWLGRKLRMTPVEVETELRPLIAEFCETDGNWISQSRLSTEYRYVSRKAKVNSVSAKALWRNKKDICERIAPIPTHTHTPLREEQVFVNGSGRQEEEPAELAQSAKDAIAAHQARERELADKEKAPAKTERGREAAKAWLERRGIPFGMQPLNKLDSLRPPATNGHAVAEAVLPSIADWPAPSAELLSTCGM